MKARAEMCELSELCELIYSFSRDEHPRWEVVRNQFLPLPS
jgi:hypothetical protein